MAALVLSNLCVFTVLPLTFSHVTNLPATLLVALLHFLRTRFFIFLLKTGAVDEVRFSYLSCGLSFPLPRWGAEEAKAPSGEWREERGHPVRVRKQWGSGALQQRPDYLYQKLDVVLLSGELVIYFNSYFSITILVFRRNLCEIVVEIG